LALRAVVRLARGLALRLRIHTSGDTLLRILRATPPAVTSPPQVIGVDDFALHKGRIFGTIVVDLERRRPRDLLPDRTAEIVAARLRLEPQVSVVSRDRAQDYARGASEGAPQVQQGVDRFHLLLNLRQAIDRYVHRVRPKLRRLLLDRSNDRAHRVQHRPPLRPPQPILPPPRRLSTNRLAHHPPTMSQVPRDPSHAAMLPILGLPNRLDLFHPQHPSPPPHRRDLSSA
jgi:transposase